MNTPTDSQTSLVTGFTSDNITGASPEIIEALALCNTGHEDPYGADQYSQRVEDKLSKIFETDVSVLLVPTGSAANAICLSAMTPPWGSVLCHPDSHINNDECGAPEFYTNGAKLISVEGPDGKLDPVKLRQEAVRKAGDVHSVQPSVVSITQATETGSIYTPEEIAAIGYICQDTGLYLHMDGARFANALTALDATPAELTWKAGVDALSFGATKNGVLAAEAIVLFDRKLTREMAFRRKRGGHLLSKMRFLSAQIDAYLTDDLWLRNAKHANAMANRLQQGLATIEGVSLIGNVEANIIFCTLPDEVIRGLLEQGFRFYHDRWGKGVVRLVTNFTTREEQVDHFISETRRLLY